MVISCNQSPPTEIVASFNGEYNAKYLIGKNPSELSLEQQILLVISVAYEEIIPTNVISDSIVRSFAKGIQLQKQSSHEDAISIFEYISRTENERYADLAIEAELRCISSQISHEKFNLSHAQELLSQLSLEKGRGVKRIHSRSRKLLLLAKFYLKESKTQEALIIICHAINQLYKYELTDDLKLLFFELLHQKAIIFTRESGDYDEEAKVALLYLVQHFPSSLSVDRQFKVLAEYQSLIDLDAENYTALQERIDRLVPQLSISTRRYFHVLKTYDALQNNVPEVAKYHVGKIFDNHQQEPCSELNMIDHLMLADVLVCQDSLIAAQDYMNKNIDLENCTESLQLRIKMYQASTEIDILLREFESSKSIQNYHRLTKKISQRVGFFVKRFGKDGSLHLQDFYIQSLRDYLHALESIGTVQDSSDIQHFVDFLQLTQANNLIYEQTVATTKYAQAHASLELQDFNRKHNDFREVHLTYDLIYDQQFEKFVQNLSMDTEDIRVASEFKKINAEAIQRSLRRQRAILMEYVYFRGDYYFFKLDGYKLSGGKLPMSNLEAKLKKSLLEISSKSDIRLESWSKDLLLDCRTCDQVFVKLDGILDLFPVELMASNASIRRVYNLADVLEEDSGLAVQKTSFVGYTNKESFNSLEKVNEFSELFGSIREQEILEGTIGLDNTYSARKATKANFQLACASSDILHITTHGVGDSIVRLNGSILLKDQHGIIDALYAFELDRYVDFPEIVFLSACETGVGVYKTGAGTNSMSQAFLQHGTKAVVKTLWKVDDKVSAELIQYFYGGIKKGNSLHHALKSAKNKIRRSYPAPYYWAGYVLEGQDVRLDF